MTNMEVWNAVKQPPSTALKPIKGGRISGMTDINPQWRYQVMTEQFGMAGVGWGYSIKRLWAEPCNDGQVFAFAEIELWTKDAEKTIPGIGGSMLITKEQSGLHASDEGYKMAVTDALSVAMKMLGVGANVYAGLSDTKYASKTMVDAAKEAGAVEKTVEHWCVEHDCKFFKSLKMKAFAHPIAGSQGADGKNLWCYEHKKETEAPTDVIKEIGELKTAGAFLNKCLKEFKLNKAQVEEKIDLKMENLYDFDGAFAFLTDVMQKEKDA